MVQSYHVVQCFSCSMFQVDIVKKAKKWTCKLCNEKQTLKKVFYEGNFEFSREIMKFQYLSISGSSKDCREHVQTSNANAISLSNQALDNLELEPQHTNSNEIQSAANFNCGSKYEVFEDDGEDDLFQGLCYNQESNFQTNNSKPSSSKYQGYSQNDGSAEVDNKTSFSKATDFQSNSKEIKNNRNQQTFKNSKNSFSSSNHSSSESNKQTSIAQKPYARSTSYNYSSYKRPAVPLDLVDFHKNSTKNPPRFSQKANSSQVKSVNINFSVKNAPFSATQNNSKLSESSNFQTVKNSEVSRISQAEIKGQFSFKVSSSQPSNSQSTKEAKHNVSSKYGNFAVEDSFEESSISSYHPGSNERTALEKSSYREQKSVENPTKPQNSLTKEDQLVLQELLFDIEGDFEFEEEKKDLTSHNFKDPKNTSNLPNRNEIENASTKAPSINKNSDSSSSNERLSNCEEFPVKKSKWNDYEEDDGDFEIKRTLLESIGK